MSFLSWIDDSDLQREVGSLLSKARSAQTTATKVFGRNVIDPFAAMFEISGFGVSYETWFESETTRQAQKTLQNHIGDFHQNILGCSRHGAVSEWTNMRVGGIIDLVSETTKSIAEIKNKFNTISGGKLADLYNSLERLVSPKASIYKQYTAYYVVIIPQKGKRYNKPFTPSDKDKGEKCPVNEQIREIDGASFYSLVTGCESALEDLYDVLPEVISICSGDNILLQNKETLKNFFNKAFRGSVSPQSF